MIFKKLFSEKIMVQATKEKEKKKKTLSFLTLT